MRLHPSLLAPLLLFAAASCGGSDPGTSIDAGYSALNSATPASALPDFDAALSGMDATHPRYLEAKLGQLRAQCYANPAAAKTGFLTFTKDTPVKAGDYRMLVTDLVTSATSQASGSEEDQKEAPQTIAYAVDILKAGKEAHPTDEKWDPLMDIVGKKAEMLGAEDALASLRGLGYVGGD